MKLSKLAKDITRPVHKAVWRDYTDEQLQYSFDAFIEEGKEPIGIRKEIAYRQRLVFPFFEKDDLSELPEATLSEIKKKIREGAKDTTQLWANALELVHKAYEVAQVQRPDITMEAAWKQYEEMISYAVRELSNARGQDGPWRSTSLTTEAIEKPDGEIDQYSVESDVDGLPVRVVRKADTIDQVMQPFFDHNITGCDIEVKIRSTNHVILYFCDKNGRTGDKVVIKKV